MTDPKTFTGPGGWQFTPDHSRAAGPHVIIAGPGVNPTEGLRIPAADLNAFIAERGQHHGQHVRCLDCLRSPLLPKADDDGRAARAEARRATYAGSTAETTIDDGTDFPAGTRVISVKTAEPCPHTNTRHCATTNDIWCHDCQRIVGTGTSTLDWSPTEPYTVSVATDPFLAHACAYCGHSGVSHAISHGPGAPAGTGKCRLCDCRRYTAALSY